MRKQPFSSRITNPSFSQLYTLPGRAKISLREPSMSKVANVVGRLEKKDKTSNFHCYIIIYIYFVFSIVYIIDAMNHYYPGFIKTRPKWI